MTPDANVLLAAFRSDHPHHRVARDWLDQAIAAATQGAPFALQPMVVASFLRLVTHPKIFLRPTTTPEALRFIEALKATPGVTLPALGPEWPSLRRLCLDLALKANDIPDAWLAAAVIQQTEHLVSFDADFKKLLSPSQFTRLQV